MPTLNFNLSNWQVKGTTTISSSDDGEIYHEDAWYATGSATSLILFNTTSSGDVFSMHTLKYKTMKSNVNEQSQPVEIVTLNSSGSSSISGKIQNAKSNSYYEVAAFTVDNNTIGDIVENSISVVPVNADSTEADFTITGLAGNTSYYAGVRTVRSNSTSRYGISSNRTLYIPSEWIQSATYITTSSPAPSVTYTIMAKNGEAAPTTVPSSLTRVVFGGTVQESGTAQLILKRNGTVLGQNVTWSTDNAEAITVNPDTGAIAIAEGAQAGAKATISAFYNNSRVTSRQITVKEEGGDVTICDQTDAVITSLETLKDTNNSQFVVKYPASMEGHLTLTAQIPENDTFISSVTEGKKVSTASSISVPYTIATKYNTGDTTVTIHAEYTATSGNTYSKDLALGVKVKDRLLEFENVGTYKDEKTNTEYNFINLWQSTTTMTDTEGNAVTLYPKVVNKLMPTEIYEFASDAPSIATIDTKTGLIKPVSAGTVTFTATSADGTMKSGVLYVVDDTPIVNTPETIHLDSPFTVTASFPEDYYMVSEIKLERTSDNFTDGNIESAYDPETKTLTVKLLKEGLNPLASDPYTLNLTFSVKAGSAITGETDITCRPITNTVSIGIGSPSGQTVSEPESKAWNLFYTDEDIKIPLPDGVDIEKGSGKWTKFYTVEADGTVKVNSNVDRKKAAGSGNNLITLPIMAGDDQIGEFQYKLPVFYQKPSLKLSSTSGKVKPKADEERPLSTTVLEKKSTGVYETLDIRDQKADVPLWAGNSGSTTARLGDEPGEVEVIHKADSKTSGNIVIQLENWSEKIELQYKVNISTKNVLTASVDTVILNTAAQNAEAIPVKILLNGREIHDSDGVKISYSNEFVKSGVEVVKGDTIIDDILEGSGISFRCRDGATPIRGKYDVKFSTPDGGSVKVKVVVSDLALAEKAVTLTNQTKMDLVSGQKMVIVPTLKGIGGTISQVMLDNDSAKLFDIEYIADINQILLSPVDVSKLDVKTNYIIKVTLTVGGVKCTATSKKFKLTAKKPTVTISRGDVKKSDVENGTAEATVNVISTVKRGGKTFVVDPIGATFTGTQQDDGTWLIRNAKGNSSAVVKYNHDTSTIMIKSDANASGTVPTVMAHFNYNAGVRVNKSIKTIVIQ